MGLGRKQDVVDGTLTHILREGMQWRRGRPALHGVVFWPECPPGTGCCCSHFPTPTGVPPKCLLCLPSQDGTAMLQCLRDKLVLCLVCSHMCTPACPCNRGQFPWLPIPFHCHQAGVRPARTTTRLPISSRSNFVSLGRSRTRVSSCFSLDRL